MPTIHLETFVAAPIEVCFDLAMSIDVHLAADAGRTGQRAVAGTTSGTINLGEEVTWEATHFGVRQRMTSRIIELQRPRIFADKMQRGPFKRWHHMHSFESKDSGTLIIDFVDYASPLGLLGTIVDALFLKNYMMRLLVRQNEFIKRLAESRISSAAN